MDKKKTTVDRFIELGYLDDDAPTAKQFAAAIRDYQRDHNLHVDAIIGDRTRRAIHDPFLRICGCDRQAMRRSDADRCRWPGKTITWAIEGSVNGLSALDTKQAFAEAYQAWARVCGVEPEFTSNAKTASIVSRVGRIDRSGGTLAWSELPCGQAVQLKQLYDAAEKWVIAENPQRYEIDLVRVATHEIGHAIGIPHIDDGNLMAPAYDPRVRRPQAGDIAQATARYGEPAPFDGPDDEPDAGGGAMSGEAQLILPDGRTWAIPMDFIA